MFLREKLVLGKLLLIILDRTPPHPLPPGCQFPICRKDLEDDPACGFSAVLVGFVVLLRKREKVSKGKEGLRKKSFRS